MHRYYRPLIYGVMALLLVGASMGCGSGRNSFAELVDEGNELRIYEVFGMDCPGCHGGIENLIDGLEGVVASKANWEKQQLSVVVLRGSEVTDEEIFAAIKRANFTPGKRVK